MTWEQWVSIIALVLATVAVVVGVVLLRKISERGARVPALTSEPRDEELPSFGPPAFVVNPVKAPNSAGLRRLVRETCAELALPEPLWFETTVEDPGLGQAEEALAGGASVVVAVGGDGTVRAVATALAGTDVPMGLVPMGTGNLLARNLDLPLESSRALVHTALTGAEHPIDLGWIRPRELRPVSESEASTAELLDAARVGDPEPDAASTGTADGGTEAPSSTDGAESAPTPPAGSAEKEPRDALARRSEHLFLVMGGIGFDAAMVAGAGDDLKAKMGWFAYFVAGARHLHGRKIRLRMEIGDAPAQQLRLRTLLFANCGRLPGGMVLLPDAEINDGWLDIAAIDTRGGLLGWASLFGKVILQGVGVRRQLAGSPSSITFWRGREVRVRCDQPEPIQVDGDLIGVAEGLSVRVDPGALTVRTRS